MDFGGIVRGDFVARFGVMLGMDLVEFGGQVWARFWADILGWNSRKKLHTFFISLVCAHTYVGVGAHVRRCVRTRMRGRGKFAIERELIGGGGSL